jgi:hypothetical protein
MAPKLLQHSATRIIWMTASTASERRGGARVIENAALLCDRGLKKRKKNRAKGAMRRLEERSFYGSVEIGSAVSPL